MDPLPHAPALMLGLALVMGSACPAWADPASPTVPAAEAPFLADNDAAMTRMMTGMAAKPTGDVDRDFVAMMAPHHQGAIDMAEVYLRYGHNPQLRRLAQEIIVTQQQEIAVMRLAVGLPLPPSAAAPTEATPTGATSTPGVEVRSRPPTTMSPAMSMHQEPK